MYTYKICAEVDDAIRGGFRISRRVGTAAAVDDARHAKPNT